MLNSGYRYEERLGRAAAGRSALSYLVARYPHSSADDWARRIAAGRVSVDGAPVSASTELTPGTVLAWDRPAWVEPDGPSSFAVLHRDDDVLVVAKPRGMAAMPGGGYLEKSLLRRVVAHDPLAAPLHRLGRGTSGITLFTRRRTARQRLTRAWEAGEVERKYLGLIVGSPPWRAIVADHPIGPVPHARLGSVAAVATSGKRAVSHVHVLERRASTTLVEVTIETGRTHQIRIHLAALGFPLHGDPLYPPGGIPDPRTSVLPGETGYHLHAHTLGFPNPATGRMMTVTCAAPEALRVRP